jgi:nitroreductase
METLEAIRKRCSLKDHLSDRPIEPEKIEMVLDAARMAPSARNMQPWRFVVVQGTEAVETFVQAAIFGASTIIAQAPVIIVVCARPSDDVTIDGKEYYLYDVGAAVGTMLLAATDLGLVTHPIASFNEAEVRKVLHIPGDVRIVIITPLAYPLEASYDKAAEERLSQRLRKDLKEVAYFGKWEEPDHESN